MDLLILGCILLEEKSATLLRHRCAHTLMKEHISLMQLCISESSHLMFVYLFVSARLSVYECVGVNVCVCVCQIGPVGEIITSVRLGV